MLWVSHRRGHRSSCGLNPHPLDPRRRGVLTPWLGGLQRQVERIHQAVQQGHVARLQEALTEEWLAVVSDHTGLPPLQKAVLFEWLSVVRYLSRGFPRTLNHPDHVSRSLPSETYLTCLLYTSDAADES